MKKLKPKEFVSKVLGGERYFEGISLMNINLIEFIPELNNYLKNTNLDKVPMYFSNSNLKGLLAPGIYLPGSDFSNSKMNSVDFSDAILINSELDNSNLSNANFYCADLSKSHIAGSIINGACFNRANLTRVCFGYSSLNKSSFNNADLTEADLRGTDLRQVTGLDSVKGLEETIMNNLILTKKEFDIIQHARNKMKYDIRTK
ncbi:MAG: pentapeptide repeat-containing protein [Candidatus Pacearchaeota archaeon]|jgi:uncharacterized protein YjbI with pentapeptide repeats